jgi:hypothetical protein
MSPFWRTLEESCKGLGSVTLKINNQHTNVCVYYSAWLAASTPGWPPSRRAGMISELNDD